MSSVWWLTRAFNSNQKEMIFNKNLLGFRVKTNIGRLNWRAEEELFCFTREN